MRIRMKVGDQAPNFEFESPWGPPRELYEAAQDRPAVLVFLRYLGCPICQMEMATLKREAGLLEEKGASVFVFVQSPTSTLAPLLNRDEWPFEIASDPDGRIYRLYAVPSGCILRYLRPAGLLTAVKAVASGYMHRKFEGRETQLPAVFVLNRDKTVRFAHYGRHIGDLPRPSAVAAMLD